MMYTDEELEKMESCLPHGSGINGDWRAWQSKEYLYFDNTFYPMNEAGFYDGYASFQIAIPKDNIEGWELHFKGSKSRYYAKKYFLREYLEDLFSYAIDDMVKAGVLK